jgi:hypothetical protein
MWYGTGVKVSRTTARMPGGGGLNGRRQDADVRLRKRAKLQTAWLNAYYKFQRYALKIIKNYS